jgi:elongation factor 1-gamma
LKIFLHLAKKYAELSSKDHVPQTQAHPRNFSQTTETKTEGGKAKKEKKPAKKEEKPVKKVEEVETAAAEEEEIDEVYADEPKQKDPFADMPKTTFNMDEFKRVYSNEDTAEKAIPYFWKNFDNEHCSIWFCEYKYSDELTQIFMTCNLVSGFFQRLDKLRKNAFGSMCVFGENNNNTITGVWIWRGHELAFEVKTSL